MSSPSTKSHIINLFAPVSKIMAALWGEDQRPFQGHNGLEKKTYYLTQFYFSDGL